MVRSYWMGTAVLALAVTGLARGQKPPQAGGPALVAPGETTVTVEEPGKPGQVCKILKSWKKRDGAWAHQVQSLKTGEIMTIEESAPAAGPPGSRLRATARRVFHWGRSRTPPPGSPVPPDAAVVLPPPPPARMPAAMAPTPVRQTVAAPKPAGIRPVGVVIEGAPGGAPSAWPSAYATGPAGSPGRAPIPLPSVGSEIVNPYVTPHVSTAPLVPQAEPQQTFVQGPDGRLRPAADGPHAAAPVVEHAEAAPPRRRLLSRLFGRDKEGDDAEKIFSAPPGAAVSPPRPTVVQGPAAVPPPLGRTVPVPAPAAVVSPPRPTVVQAPAVVPPAPRMTPVPAPAVTAAVPAPAALRPVPSVPFAPASPTTPPDFPRRASVVMAPPAPTAAPVMKPVPAPIIMQAPAPAPAARLAPPPVIVKGPAATAGEPVILNKGDGGRARVPGEPVIVSEPSRILKPSDDKVTTVLTTTPAVVTPPAKGKPAEPDNSPRIVTGPVSGKATASAPGNEGASTGAPRPGVASRNTQPTRPAPAVVAAPPKPAAPVITPAKAGDWRESWGKAVPSKNDTTAQAATVAPRPTAWTLPPEKRADRIFFPKPDGKPDPLADPASYTRLTRHDSDKPSSPTTGATPRSAEVSPTVLPALPAPVGRRGPQPVQVAETEGNAFSPPQPATPPPPAPSMANAFVGTQAGQPALAQTAYGPPPQMGYLPQSGPPVPAYPPGYAMARPPYYPPMSPPVVNAGTPTGMANAFTPAGNTRPIPADFGPPQFAANGFSAPGQQDDGAPPNQPVPPPLPGYFPPMAARGYGPAPSAAIAQAGEVSPPQLLATLRGALLPSQREWAADRLADLDWRTNPLAVDALATAAHDDPAATVRAGCVRSLARMKVNTVPVVAVVEGLKRDADPRVRLEAEEALTVLGGRAPRNDGGVRPASATGPGPR